MAWSSSAISTLEQGRKLANKPIILARNVLSLATSIKWVGIEDHAASDLVNSDYPTALLYDGRTHLRTRPNSGATQHYLSIYFGASVEFDSIWIKHSNLDGKTFKVVRADNSVYSTNKVSLVSGTVNTNPLININFESDNRRISGTGYLLIDIGGSSFTPQIGEIFLAKRIQLNRSTDISNAFEVQRDSRVRDVRSESGVITRYTYFSGGRNMTKLFTAHTDADVSLLKRIDEESDFMTKPFVYFDRPHTNLNDAPLFYPEASFDMPIDGFTSRSVLITATEQGPDFLDSAP